LGYNYSFKLCLHLCLSITFNHNSKKAIIVQEKNSSAGTIILSIRAKIERKTFLLKGKFSDQRLEATYVVMIDSQHLATLVRLSTPL